MKRFGPKGRLFEARISAARRFLSSNSGLRLLTRAMPEKFPYVGMTVQGQTIFTKSIDAVTRVMVLKGEWAHSDGRKVLEILAEESGAAQTVALEVGAHIGLQTIQFAQAPHISRVVACEPMPEHLMLLAANLAANQVAEKVSVVPFAVGAKAERVVVQEMDSNSAGNSLVKGLPAREGHGVEIDVITAGDMLARAGVSAQDVGLLWVDAEGMEYDILMSCYAEGMRPKVTMIEFSPQFYGDNTDAFIAFLQAHHTNVCRIDDGLVTPLDWSDLSSMVRQVDLILTGQKD